MAVTEITVEEFDDRINDTEEPVLVEFYSTECGPCNALRPVISELADEADGYRIYSIEAKDASELTDRYNIMSLQTILFFKNGEVVRKTIGYRSKENLVSLINEYR